MTVQASKHATPHRRRLVERYTNLVGLALSHLVENAINTWFLAQSLIDIGQIWERVSNVPPHLTLS